jgi:XTP/dITP diphosphohydrolase
MELWIATGNAGKLREYQMQLKEIPDLKLHHQGEISGFSPRPEDGKTFLDNARIKAKTLKSVRSDVWVLGEDAGLEVAGIGGLPGIHSARYAGPKASESENVAKLLKMMQIRAVTDRSARFVCTSVFYTPDGTEWVFEGEMKGSIAKLPAGQHGFGYDPVFIPEGETKTLAELGSGYKVQHSHRSKALKAFLAKLQSL